MAQQPSLFGDARLTAFAAYHADNPQVYVKLREFALAARAAGMTHLGIGMLYERLRWFVTIETRDDAWKLNNNYRAYYARLLMLQEAELAGFFELRASRADIEGPPP